MKANFQTMMKLRSSWSSFRRNHPNILPFLNDVLKKGIREDVQIEMRIHFPDGDEKNCGIRLRESDLPLFTALQELF